MNAPFWWPDTKSMLAFLVVASNIAIAFVLIYRPGAAESDTLKVLIGGLMTVGFATIISYYFGSSQESTSKGQTIATIAMNGKKEEEQHGH
jgi:hypothetical protein